MEAITLIIRFTCTVDYFKCLFLYVHEFGGNLLNVIFYNPGDVTLESIGQSLSPRKRSNADSGASSSQPKRQRERDSDVTSRDPETGEDQAESLHDPETGEVYSQEDLDTAQ